MIRRITKFIVGLIFVVLVAGCHHNKVNNPIANIDSKQPDKVLFDRAMDAMKKGKYDVARITLQTLINTYPDSEFIARAKLSVGDSWYAEGGTAAFVQAGQEYGDFITFFPNVPEAKQRLLEVQEVLGDREFEIGRFYYLRQSYPASIARLQSLVQKYPLYS